MRAANCLKRALCVLVPALLAAPHAYAADELSAPDVVGIGEHFPVVWFGDRANGDKVTIAEPGASAADAVSDRNMGSTNTITIQAPFQAGTYELRYLSGQTILDSQPLEVVGGITVGSGGGSSGGGSSGGSGSQVPQPADDIHTYSEILLLKGYQIEHASQPGEMMQKREEMCQQWRGAMPALSEAGEMTEREMRAGMSKIDPALASLLLRVEGALNMAGIDIFEDFQEHLGTAEDALCDDIDAPYAGHFTITYAHCRMTMDTPTQSMDIHMPPGSPAAYMQAVDFSKGEGVLVDLARDIRRTTPATGEGFASGVTMTAAGGSAEVAGHETHNYKYEYTANMGGSGAAPGMDMIAGMVSVKNEGSAWVAPNIEGDSIPRRFYWNLATQVQPASGVGGFFSGLIMNVVGLMQHGLPLKINSRVTSRILGKSVISGDSESTILDIGLVPMPAGWCTRDIVPPGFEITNVSEQLDQAMGQEGMPSNDEMSAAMQQMNEAMAQMTPQQRAMVENMGLGDMMGMGAAGAGSANPRASQQPAASAPAPAVRKGSKDSLSTALQGKTLTESAKNYLQVLGYDTGDAGSEMNLETTIAISQFQAENNMKATGEVSPQLIGLLAAKVDAL